MHCSVVIQSYNPMCEPCDDFGGKLDESIDPAKRGSKPKTDQSDLSFPSGPSLSEDDDELTESKIKAFLDEKVILISQHHSLCAENVVLIWFYIMLMMKW